MKRNISTIAMLISALTPAIAFSELNDSNTENNPQPKPDIRVLSESRSADNYWTAERLRAAKPMPEPEVSDEEREQTPSPDSLANPENETTFILEPSRSEPEESAAWAQGQPEEANVNQRPFWNAGKLFFSAPDGDFNCTAQFVGHKRVLMTAAHCIRDHKTGAWYKNFVFYQRYKNNSWDKSFQTRCMAVWSDWVTGTDKQNWSKDYGFLTTHFDSGAGWLGLMSGIPHTQWTAIGYPSNYMEGSYMQKVNGRLGEKQSNGEVRMDGNPMKKGSSGGAWIAELNTDNASGNYAVGINAKILSNYPDSTFGPYFDAKVFDLHKAAKDACYL